MSLSNPRGTTNPVQRYFTLKLSTGQVTHYNKDAKKDVVVADPFTFIVLDALSVIGGYSDDKKSGIWSNEVRSTRDEELVVRTRDGVLVKGLYSDIRDTIKAEGGKFGKSLFIAFLDDGEWKLGNLKLIGAGFSEWFDFEKGKRFDADPGVLISSWEERRKGRNEYFVPVFESWEVGADDLHAAMELDKQLQEYLGSKKSDDTPQRESAPAVEDEFEEAPPF